MRLVNCHIENFGRLRDFSCIFQEGCNYIREDNGFGKSTLAAFIRVMFYGFQGDSKRSILDNERRRYEPWQGGVYGGQLTFSDGAKTYIVSRTFGAKAASDTYELRDAATNLVSSDYSEHLGEELFGINSESYMRTAFIGQKDSMTRATDDINAKIGGIADTTADIDSYQRANDRLQSLINAMAPNRRTGSISRMKSDYTELEGRVNGGRSLGQSLEALQGMIDDTGRKVTEEQEALDKYKGLQTEVSHYKDLKGSKEIYTRLLSDVADRQDTYDARARLFPVRVPSEEELDRAISLSQEISADRTAMDSAYMTSGETAAFNRLDEELRDYAADDMGVKELKSVIGRDYKKAKVLGGTGRLGIALAVTGAVGLVISLVVYLLIYSSNLVLAAGIMALVLAIIGFIVYRGADRKRRDQMDYLEGLLDSVYEYVTLRDKSIEYARVGRIYNNKKTELDRFINGVGMSHDGDIFRRLQQMKTDYYGYMDAKRELEQANRALEDFQEANDAEELQNTVIPDRLPNLEQIDAEIRTHRQALDALRQQQADYHHRMESLKEEYEGWVEAKDELNGLKSTIEESNHDYETLKAAQKYLTAAKEAITAKYMDPLLSGFVRYYGSVDGDSVDDFRIDANSNILKGELGALRDTELLSVGYQDLIGFCMRMSYIDAMYKGEKPALILDDPFVNLDDDKLHKAYNLLKDIGSEYQLIYFTCRGSE